MRLRQSGGYFLGFGFDEDTCHLYSLSRRSGGLQFWPILRRTSTVGAAHDVADAFDSGVDRMVGGVGFVTDGYGHKLDYVIMKKTCPYCFMVEAFRCDPRVS